jgi:protein involved in sex pheromone biosynthesis
MNEIKSVDERNVVIQGLDLLDVVHYIAKKNKRYQAMALSNIEEVLDKDSPEFKHVRKVILDYFNNYTRSVIRNIFGESLETLVDKY